MTKPNAREELIAAPNDDLATALGEDPPDNSG